MKKSSFVAMVLGTIAMVFFALGMCMTMLPQWNTFNLGIILGAVGILFAIITVFVWRKMEKKQPIKISGKSIGVFLLATVGTLALGVGMCFSMVWNSIFIGVIIGLVGILALMSLIPICKGLK